MSREPRAETPTEARLRGALEEIGQLASEQSAVARPLPRGIHGWRPRLLPAAGVAAALAALVVGSAAVAGSLSNETKAPQHARGPVDPVTQHVDRLANQLVKLEDEPGYGRISVDYDTHTVTVLWNGTLPDTVRTVLAGASSDVTTIIRHARYSLQVLVAAEGRVVRASQAGRWNRSIVSAAPTADFAGLAVESTDPASVPLAELRQVAGVPVTLEQGGAVHE